MHLSCARIAVCSAKSYVLKFKGKELFTVSLSAVGEQENKIQCLVTLVISKQVKR